MTSDRISFARTLPIVALLLSYLIIAIPATITFANEKIASRSTHNISRQVAAPHDHALRFSTADASHAIQAINLPGFLVEMALSVITGSWPHGWSPASINLLTWRALAFPIYCLAFWYFVGLGLDALSGERRLRPWVLFAGSLLWILFVLLLGVSFFGISAAQRTGMILPYWGCTIWIACLTAFPASSIKEWLAHRRVRSHLQRRLLTDA